MTENEKAPALVCSLKASPADSSSEAMARQVIVRCSDPSDPRE